MPFLSRFRPIPLEGPKFALDNASRACPRCQHILPYGFELDTNFNIALVGDSFSGKSHYIAALLHLLIDNRIKQNENISVRLRPLNAEARSKWAEFHETLFVRHQPLGGTPPEDNMSNGYAVREPMIFRLEIAYLAENVISALNLILYDIAGEDIVNQKLSIWPIMEAQALIYFVDPLNMVEIVKALPDTHPQVADARNFLRNPQRTEPHQILEEILRIFTRHNLLGADNKINTPTAILLSKLDIIDEIAKSQKISRLHFLQPGTSIGTVDGEDLTRVDEDMQTFFRQFKEIGILQDRQFFPNSKFFAVSATGCAPTNGVYNDIQPRRILDPLLWLLLKLTENRA